MRASKGFAIDYGLTSNVVARLPDSFVYQFGESTPPEVAQSANFGKARVIDFPDLVYGISDGTSTAQVKLPKLFLVLLRK